MGSAGMRRRRARQRTRRRLTALGVGFALALAGTVGYAVRADTAGAAASGGVLHVVTTTTFLDDTVRRVGGEWVDTVRLMGPGVDPHLYQARAGDLEQMRRADLVVGVGLYLEGAMQHVLTDVARSKPVLLVGERLPADRLLEPAAGAPAAEEHDPHIWFDPALWAEVVDVIAEELARLDPSHAAGYRERADRYRGEVLGLLDEVARILALVPEHRRTLVTSHDAFRYFGRAFGVRVVAIQGISTEEEATTADISRVADELLASGVPAVFVESSVPRQTLEAVLAAVRQRGGDVRIGGELFSDSAGDDGTPAGSYLGMVRANAHRLAEGLA
ncbi:manganese/zinc/iron transport system substrate-binding protein [Amycolatopsis arida]|uniref:Manganese/zinc/iron transport system substrate-binding protein n=1 Tax=Amycolatopsis arida TaxID=587909 RepID=A0A1I6A6C7_9PSEU|nr:zinc ABC transporter substrate-binding protein [Amycolatopsis arida]TDX88583.1 manganese/zinc/iron transport system substrate-binding protein [Amycolatopsis arida]SFQ64200.1 manganese/zinc/iron transport system substrate-binding protein [Amycolatopsis arida]